MPQKYLEFKKMPYSDEKIIFSKENEKKCNDF